MNYIKRLQATNETLATELERVQKEVGDFINFLQTAKFTGADLDGGRKDWIATADTIGRLRSIVSPA